MCVIIMKPAGVALPDYETFDACFDTNPDGFGMCWSDGNTVTLDKGYMGKQSAWLAMNKVQPEHAAIFHFRISTGGLVDSGACHPYPVTNNANQLRQLYMKNLPYAVAHNGVIGKGGSVLNDTQLWIQHELVRCMGTTHITEMFLDASAKDHHSRFVILYGDGSYHLAGDWTKHGELYFSNMLWDWDYYSYRRVSKSRTMDDEWAEWYRSYDEAIADGFAPVCPVCGSYNTIGHIESYLGLCECCDCNSVFSGLTNDIYTIDYGAREANATINRKAIKKAAYYGV